MLKQTLAHASVPSSGPKNLSQVLPIRPNDSPQSPFQYAAIISGWLMQNTVWLCSWQKYLYQFHSHCAKQLSATETNSTSHAFYLPPNNEATKLSLVCGVCLSANLVSVVQLINCASCTAKAKKGFANSQLIHNQSAHKNVNLFRWLIQVYGYKGDRALCLNRDGRGAPVSACKPEW